MSNLGLQKRDYNFFSSAIDSKRSARKKGTLLVLLIILYLMLILGAYLILESAIKSSRNQIESIESYLFTEEVSMQQELALNKKQQIETLLQYSDSINSFLDYMQQIDIIGTEYIEQVTSAIPQDLFFDNISMTADQLQIQGTAPNRQIIAEYLNNMEALNWFKDVHVSSITTVSKRDETISDTNDMGVINNYSFVMNCQLKDVMEE